MPFSKAYLQHVAKEHGGSSLSWYLKEIVYGGTDGIVTTFAIVASFTGASGSDTAIYPVIVVLIFGLANLFGDAASMGLANILSTRSEQKLYKKEFEKELHEIMHNTEFEAKESLEILKDKWINDDDAIKFLELYKKYPKFWAEFMMEYEIKLLAPDSESPVKNAIDTAWGFIVFGFIPLIPYVFGFQSNNMFWISTTFAAAALILLGTLRGRITRESLWRSIIETLLLGGIAASIAYIVGVFFK